MPSILALLSGAATWVVLALLVYSRHRAQSRVSESLVGYGVERHGVTTSNKPIQTTLKHRLTLRDFVARFALRRLVSRYTPVLEQAGIPLRAEEMAGAVALSSFIGMLLGLVGLGVFGAIVGGILGYMLPGEMLKAQINKRLRKAEEQLEEFLTFAASALRAGNSLLQAMELAGRDLTAPISSEMKRTVREIGLGVSMEDAWNRLLSRLPSADLDLAVTAVLIQRQIGGDLAAILDNIATTIRERRRVKSQVNTLTAQGRLSGIVIALLPFFLFVLFVIINPTYISLLWREPVGLLMLGMGVISQVIGMVLIKRIVNIEY